MADVYITEVPYDFGAATVRGRVSQLNSLSEAPECWHCDSIATVLVVYDGYGWGKGMHLFVTTCAAHSGNKGFHCLPGATVAVRGSDTWE